jgi:hypothetical protein
MHVIYYMQVCERNLEGAGGGLLGSVGHAVNKTTPYVLESCCDEAVLPLERALLSVEVSGVGGANVAVRVCIEDANHILGCCARRRVGRCQSHGRKLPDIHAVRCQRADRAFLQHLACTGPEQTALEGQCLAATDAPPRRGREGHTNVSKAIRAQV